MVREHSAWGRGQRAWRKEAGITGFRRQETGDRELKT